MLIPCDEWSIMPLWLRIRVVCGRQNKRPDVYEPWLRRWRMYRNAFVPSHPVQMEFDF